MTKLLPEVWWLPFLEHGVVNSFDAAVGGHRGGPVQISKERF